MDAYAHEEPVVPLLFFGPFNFFSFVTCCGLGVMIDSHVPEFKGHVFCAMKFAGRF